MASRGADETQLTTPKSRIVASLDRKRLGQVVVWRGREIRPEAFSMRTKPLAFAADALSYGI